MGSLIKRPAARVSILALTLVAAGLAGLLLAQRTPEQPANAAGAKAVGLTIDYPNQGSLFPPDIAAPTFLWRDATPNLTGWQIEVAFADGLPIRVQSKGELMRVGEIDERAIAPTNKLPELTPQQAVSHTWTPDAATWAAIKLRSVEHAATVAISGIAGGRPVSRGEVAIRTSIDPVGAPIFYRDVPLAPSETEKGIIKPLAPGAIPLIAWRLRNIAEPRSRLLLTGMHTCANCHSFSGDGKTLGMDLDGPQNDKGLYALVAVKPQMTIRTEDMISWNRSADRQYGQSRVGFMSQVSPDGKYVVTTISGTVRPTQSNFYVVNFKDYRFLQVFYPTAGILAWYDRSSGREQPLPGADDPHYVQTDGVWSPDGKYLVFARAEARSPDPPGGKLAEYANDPAEVQIQYDLYRIPFNGGLGGQPERIEGASANGMSNTFPKISPDGRWIVFVKCKNGQLMRPDSQLYIVPAQGGEARRLACNTPLMNSWHSFSPNGHWLVFSSKSRSHYTQMFLTHLDQEGISTPAILIEHSTAANRAVNIPEFVNIRPDGIEKIDVPATDFYKQFDVAFALSDKRQYQAAIPEWKKALEMDPNDAKAHINLGTALAETGQPDAALVHLQKAIDLNPVNANAYSAMASLLVRTGKPGDAVAYYEKSLQLKPDDAKLHNSVGLVLAITGHPGDAIAHYRKALRSDPAYADSYAHLGVALAQSGQAEEAIPLLEKALELDPKDEAAESNLGAALAQKGRIEDSIAHCRKALALNANDAQAHTNLAIALSNAGKPEDALPHFEKAVQLVPDDASFQSNLGAALAGRGRIVEAIPHFRNALDAHPEDVQAMVNLAIALASTGKADEAIPHLEKAAQLAPGDSGIQTNLGAALVDRGRIEAAIPHLEQAVEAAPQSADAHYHLGAAYAGQNRIANAMGEWRNALAIDPNYVTALFRVAQVLASNPNPSLRNGGEAVELAERAAKLTGGRQPAILDTLAAAYAEAGRFTEATATARRALAIANQQKDAQLAAGLSARIALYQAGTPFRTQ
jgi:tetratricopeptide (TPR) repeat protein